MFSVSIVLRMTHWIHFNDKTGSCHSGQCRDLGTIQKFIYVFVSQPQVQIKGVMKSLAFKFFLKVSCMT